ncbi:TadE family protein [Phenylobacterium sp.]|uniref:TadE/TadG family type IV pilus assembly protein n=1 Tax=Phenylobacterium sp. TaxID=1871053 RepID=UPI002DF49E20|nr:TadE family protein [Phenylobacterium sp.]
MAGGVPIFWRLRDCEQASAAVESAFILPVLLLLLLGGMEFARLAWERSALQFAVQEAARCAVVQPGVCGTTAQTQAFAAAKMTGFSIPAADFAVTTPACGTQVAASVPYSFILFPIFSAAPTLTARVCRN